MKKSIFIAFAMLVAGLSSCNKNEAPALEAAEPAANESFKVIEEGEMTIDQLYDATLGSLKQSLEANIFDGVDKAYEQATQATAYDPESRATAPLLYKTVRIEYTTLDQDDQPVTASALIVYPLLRKMVKVMLINHGTQIGIAMIPTKYTSVEAAMAATGALCIMPDYIGLGSSADHPDLYLNHKVHGQTSVDALLALLDYAKAKKLSLNSNYKTYIVGYSQGGSVSLASLRRVQELDQATQDRLHLTKVYCGDGPYDLRRTFETYVEDFKNGKELGLGSVIPLVINSMFNSYPSEVADLRYEDFFTEWALSTGVPQAIKNNDENMIDMLVKFNGKKLNEILNMEYTEAHQDHLDRLLELMDRQNLCRDWQPKYALKLLHGNPDGVVPFSNFEEAVAGLQNQSVETKVVNINDKILTSPLLQHVYGMLIMVEEVLSGDF